MNVSDLAAVDAVFRAHVTRIVADAAQTDPPWRDHVKRMVAAGASHDQAEKIAAPRGKGAHLPGPPPPLLPAGETPVGRSEPSTHRCLAAGLEGKTLDDYLAHLARHVVVEARRRKAAGLFLVAAAIEDGMLTITTTVTIDA